jgi:hypothetical protein
MEMTEEQLTEHLAHLVSNLRVQAEILETLQQQYFNLTGRRYVS